MIVYLLHFDPPYKHAAHYFGVTSGNLRDALHAFGRGLGDALPVAAIRNGSQPLIGRTWKPRTKVHDVDEMLSLLRSLRRTRSAGRYCLLCQKARRAERQDAKLPELLARSVKRAEKAAKAKKRATGVKSHARGRRG